MLKTQLGVGERNSQGIQTCVGKGLEVREMVTKDCQCERDMVQERIRCID